MYSWYIDSALWPLIGAAVSLRRRLCSSPDKPKNDFLPNNSLVDLGQPDLNNLSSSINTCLHVSGNVTMMLTIVALNNEQLIKES